MKWSKNQNLTLSSQQESNEIMKKVALIICSVFFVFIVNAQNNKYKVMSFGIGPMVSLPVGNLGSVSGVGFGGEIDLDYTLNKHYEAFGQVAYQAFPGKAGFSSYDAPSFVFGARYYITNRFHVGLGLGYINYVLPLYDEDGLDINPQIGYRFGNFNLMAQYTYSKVGGGQLAQGGVNYNVIGLKLTYKLSSIFQQDNK